MIVESEDVKAPEAPKEKTPMEYLLALPGAPTEAQVKGWKAQVPNGVLRIFTPDLKRFFLLRGLSGLEMRKVQESIPQNSSDPEADFKLGAVALTCIWTNITVNNKLDEMTLRSGSAGLPETLFSIVENLSDYFAPAQVMQMCSDI